MAVRNQDFEMWQGEDKRLVFTVEDVDDLTGAAASWRLSHSRGSPAILTKSGAGQIELDIAAKTFTVILDSADTINQPSRSYFHQLRIVDADDNRNKGAEGQLTLHPSTPD